jgi:hypothetical protein
MIQLTVTADERRQLEDVLKTTTDPCLRARCQAILMAHRGRRHRHIAEDLELSHLELYRLPSDSPQLQVLERFWRVLRRRATHNRLFLTLAQRKRALRNSWCDYHTLKHRVRSLIQSPKKRTKLSVA